MHDKGCHTLNQKTLTSKDKKKINEMYVCTRTWIFARINFFVFFHSKFKNIMIYRIHTTP